MRITNQFHSYPYRNSYSYSWRWNWTIAIITILLSLCVTVIGWTGIPFNNCRLPTYSHQNSCEGACMLRMNVHDENEHEIVSPPMRGSKAFRQQTPHSGAHFTHTHPSEQRQRKSKWLSFLRNRRKKYKSKRFFEGWYYRVTLPEVKQSFVFIFSIEDPFMEKSNLTLSACQVMGPNDEYLVQADVDDSKFWAWREQQGLGCTFEWNQESEEEEDYSKRGALNPKIWREKVKTGFQMLPQSLQGRLVGHDGTKGGVLEGQGNPGECSWDLTLTPVSGWGDSAIKETRENNLSQKSTAGWLASYPVFEPHWQVTMANAKASGKITWKNQTYCFEDQPFYAEKNWGGSFPTSWYWAQCNSFDGYPELAVTAGGGRRLLPFFGKTEDLGMIGIHFNGTFYEAVPWTGEFEWSVKPWGRWEMKGLCTSGELLFQSELKAICSKPGVDLRAPTQYDGLEYFCRDSLLADIELSLWEIKYDKKLNKYVKTTCLVDRARSSQGGVEVGGDLWKDESSEGWKAISCMRQPMRNLVKIPYVYEQMRRNMSRRKKV